MIRVRLYEQDTLVRENCFSVSRKQFLGIFLSLIIECEGMQEKLGNAFIAEYKRMMSMYGCVENFLDILFFFPGMEFNIFFNDFDYSRLNLEHLSSWS